MHRQASCLCGRQGERVAIWHRLLVALAMIATGPEMIPNQFHGATFQRRKIPSFRLPKIPVYQVSWFFLPIPSFLPIPLVLSSECARVWRKASSQACISTCPIQPTPAARIARALGIQPATNLWTTGWSCTPQDFPSRSSCNLEI